MRIAIGQLWQETNTLNPVLTTRADFEEMGICRGADLVEQMAEVNELGGFIQSLRHWPDPPEIVGLVRLPAWPSGLATRETFDWLLDEVVSSLESQLPVDGVLLALHGSMVADQHPDVEGEVLQAVRRLIGDEVPLVATLDLHANVTREMVAAADVLVPYHSMPHIDIHETGQRAAEVLRRILLDGAKPHMAFEKIAAVVPPEHSSTEAAAGPAVDFKRQVVKLEQQPSVLAAGLLPVQPWLDIPQLGSSVVVTTDGDSELADRECARVAGEFWARREEYLPELLTAAEAVERSRQHLDGLVVLSDAADATTSGAPGDSVWLLKELVKHEWPRAALVTVVSPELVAQCEAVAKGDTLSVQLGGVRDTRFGTTISLDVELVRCFDARFTMSGHIGRNMPIDMGRSAVIRQGNVHVIITSRSGPHFAPELFQTAGFDPFAASIVVAKSPCGFRAVYEDRAAAVFSVKAPGCAPSDFWNYDFKNIPRPLWPWDK